MIFFIIRTEKKRSKMRMSKVDGKNIIYERQIA